jgi:diketogulonate reductase-like aldo/keto reductase
VHAPTATLRLPLAHDDNAVAHDDATIAYCAERGITYEAWRVLGGCPFSDARVGAIAAAHNVSVAQVCVRWTLQRGAIVAAGTGNGTSTVGEYARENLGALHFALSAAEMDYLNAKSPP